MELSSEQHLIIWIKLTDILLYICSYFDENKNRLLLILSIEYRMNSKRFDGSLF